MSFLFTRRNGRKKNSEAHVSIKTRWHSMCVLRLHESRSMRCITKAPQAGIDATECNRVLPVTLRSWSP